MAVHEEFLWVEKYRPKTVAETILPPSLKKQFQSFVDKGNFTNILISGRPGMGKTTVAKAMLEEIDADYIMINASMNGGIDTLRTVIANYATAVSMQGGRKFVILDEADALTAATQASLRGFIEEYSSNCGFILTCNFKNKIIEPLRDSRFYQIDLQFDASERQSLMLQFFKRVKVILDKEGIEFDPAIVAAVIDKQFPDFRRCLNTLQSASMTGSITVDTIRKISESGLKELFGFLKAKKFEDMRKWVGEHQDVDSIVLFRNIYDECINFVEPSSMPGVIVTLGEFLHRHALVADPEINMAAFLTTIMFEAKFK